MGSLICKYSEYISYVNEFLAFTKTYIVFISCSGTNYKRELNTEVDL